MGLSGGALRTPVPRGADLQRIDRPAPLAVGAPSAGGYLVRGDDARSLGLALDLLQRGASLRRVPGSGEIVVDPGADAAVVAAAAARGAGALPLAAGAAPASTVPLRPVKVAVLSAGSATSAVPPGNPIPTASPDWCRWVLETRFGLHVDVLGDGELAAGQLVTGVYTTLLVPDGDDALGGLGPAALAQIQAFVRAGGRYIGWRARGVAIAGAAGVTGARAETPPGLKAPGTAVELQLDPSSPLAWGMPSQVYALDEDDPVLRFGDGVVGRYPAPGDLWHAGYIAGAGALGNTPAVLDAPFGAGDVVLFSFDPAFRGYADGTERLLANALLATRTS